MENIKLNGINEYHNKILEEKEELHSNKSMNRSNLISPKIRTKDITLKATDKNQKGLSSSIFPKTGKEKNSQIINLKLANGSLVKNNLRDKNEKKSIKFLNKNNKSFNNK